MPGRRILRIVTTPTCSLCDTAIERLRTPARILGVTLDVVGLVDVEDGARYATRTPVVLDGRGRVLAEGRIAPVAAWAAVLRARIGPGI